MINLAPIEDILCEFWLRINQNEYGFGGWFHVICYASGTYKTGKLITLYLWYKSEPKSHNVRCAMCVCMRLLNDLTVDQWTRQFRILWLKLSRKFKSQVHRAISFECFFCGARELKWEIREICNFVCWCICKALNIRSILCMSNTHWPNYYVCMWVSAW